MSDGVFEFRPRFQELIINHENVTAVWVGNGEGSAEDGPPHGTAGTLYAGYPDGPADLGYITMYDVAVHEGGYSGSALDWMQTVVNFVDAYKAQDIVVRYMNTNINEPQPYEDDVRWDPIPYPTPGKVTWCKITLSFLDGVDENKQPKYKKTNLYMAAYTGMNGQDGADGQDGKDGFSPTVTTAAIQGGHRFTITDVNGTRTVDVMDGVQGEQGEPGEDGLVVSVNGISQSDIVLYGTDINIDNSQDAQTVKQYIDNKSFEPTIATDAQIDAIFS